MGFNLVFFRHGFVQHKCFVVVEGYLVLITADNSNSGFTCGLRPKSRLDVGKSNAVRQRYLRNRIWVVDWYFCFPGCALQSLSLRRKKTWVCGTTSTPPAKTLPPPRTVMSTRIHPSLPHVLPLHLPCQCGCGWEGIAYTIRSTSSPSTSVLRLSISVATVRKSTCMSVSGSSCSTRRPRRSEESLPTTPTLYHLMELPSRTPTCSLVRHGCLLLLLRLNSHFSPRLGSYKDVPRRFIPTWGKKRSSLTLFNPSDPSTPLRPSGSV